MKIKTSKAVLKLKRAWKLNFFWSFKTQAKVTFYDVKQNISTDKISYYYWQI